MAAPPQAEPEAAAHVFHQQPSDQALILSHLLPLVTGAAGGESDEAVRRLVHHASIYAGSPAALCSTFTALESSDGERAWYFISDLQPIPLRSRGARPRYARKAGDGWWRGEARELPVLADGRQVGRRLTLSFVRKEDGDDVRTGWIMSQLRLLPPEGAAHGARENLRALCRVYRSARHPGDGGLAAANDEVRDGNEATETVAGSTGTNFPAANEPTGTDAAGTSAGFTSNLLPADRTNAHSPITELPADRTNAHSPITELTADRTNADYSITELPADRTSARAPSEVTPTGTCALSPSDVVPADECLGCGDIRASDTTFHPAGERPRDGTVPPPAPTGGSVSPSAGKRARGGDDAPRPSRKRIYCPKCHEHILDIE